MPVLPSYKKNVLLVISSKIDFQDSLQHFKSGYVCKKCFQLASTYQRVKSELDNTEDRLMKNLQFVWQSQGSQVTRAAKRPTNSETNVKQKKVRMETSDGTVTVSF